MKQQEQLDEAQQGMREEDIQAFALFCRAAKAGHGEAQFIVSRCYHWGHGVQSDQAQVLDWLRNSAESGFAEAQHSLGCCHRDGQGVPDYEEVVKLLNQEKDQLSPKWKRVLAKLTRTYGPARLHHKLEAYKWLQLAADQGHEKAEKEAPALAALMSPAEFAAAYAIYEEFKDKHAE